MAVAAAVTLGAATACSTMPSEPRGTPLASASPAPTTPSPTPVASPTRPAPTPTPTRHPTATPRPTAGAVLSRMPLAARVGQLLMVGVPAAGSSDAALRQLSRYRVGGVILTGRSHAGTGATATLTARVRAAVPGLPVLIATDQEGGAVQVLTGPGFSPMPSALSQGRLSPADLRTRART